MTIEAQISEKVRLLPKEAQAAMLVIANEWAQINESENAADDALLLELLKKRSQQAKEHPELRVPADEVMARLYTKWSQPTD